MTDTPTAEIVKRLRERGSDGEGVWRDLLLREAASRLEQLEAENKRLREALERIRKMKPEPVGDDFVTGPRAMFDACQRTARAALSSTRGDSPDTTPSGLP